MNIRAAVQATVTLVGIVWIVPCIAWLFHVLPSWVPIALFGSAILGIVWYALYYRYSAEEC